MSDQSAVVEKQTDDFDDVGGDVAAALNELRGGEAPEPETKITIDRAERPRDEAGRFTQALAKTEDKPKREILTLPEKDKPVEGVQADPAAQLGVPAPAATPAPIVPQTPAIKPPEALKGELKAKFAELPPEWQQEIVRREAEAHKALTSQDEERQLGRKINQVVTPYLPTIRAEGATVEKAFENYLQTAHVLRSGTPLQKAQALHSIAQAFSVDLNLPLQQAGSDPRYAHLEHQLSELQNRLQAQDHQRQQQEDQNLRSQIDAFASQPGHEHFEKVKVRMGALLDSGEAKDLEDAYQQATWSHPEIRSTLVEAQTRAAEEKRIAEQKALSERARSAAVSVTGAPGSSRPLNGAQSHGSIEDDVRAAMSEVRGRV